MIVIKGVVPALPPVIDDAKQVLLDGISGAGLTRFSPMSQLRRVAGAGMATVGSS